MPIYDVAILGAGPVGLVAALELSKHCRTLLVAKRLPDLADPRRVDVLPAAAMAFLVELGIAPGAIGCERPYSRRWLAWNAATPEAVDGPPTVHVERPALDCALLTALLRSRRVAVVLDHQRPSRHATWIGRGWRARRIIDATGRSAVTAGCRIRADRPWVASTLTVVRRASGSEPEFRLAGLDAGYVYRLGSSRTLAIGTVGHWSLANASANELEARILRQASWILSGLPSLAEMRVGRKGAASVQICDAGPALLVGDASLARDPLSSQGLAAGFSDALYAASVCTAGGEELFERRRLQQRSEHLSFLYDLTESCRFAGEPTWRGYRAFLQSRVSPAPNRQPVALIDGRLTDRASAPRLS